MKRLLVALSFLLTLGVVVAGAMFVYVKDRVEAPGPLSERTVVRVPPGSGVQAIALRLDESGVIEAPLLFVLLARVTGTAPELKAGEFAFPPGTSLRGALDILVAGETVARKLTLPEGITSREAAARLRAAEGLTGTLVSVPAEGSLLPETYHYRWGDSRAALVARMQAAMEEALDALWPDRAPDLPFDTREEAITLASIVEKETAVPEERALVAGVFVNRLRRGMRLQSDPTVRYALSRDGDPLDRPLTRADLEVADPYNTYRHAGLPPGPIANPGRASLAAVLTPAQTDYLYFVADGSGGHAFAETLDGHNANVRAWRRIRDGGDADGTGASAD